MRLPAALVGQQDGQHQGLKIRDGHVTSPKVSDNVTQRAVVRQSGDATEG
jgi:hypothetical protein